MSEPPPRGYGFGTFKGVFTPSVLTVLGVVMYLRMGWVLGNAGLPGTLLIVTIASGITFLTALSLAALATNMTVGGGGAYYIISRSLGVEAGAAIGLPLYLAQALGISFYLAGFSESVVEVLPGLDPVGVGVATLGLLAALVYVSADLALRSQFVIMAAIAASLASFFLGGPVEPPPAEPPPPTLPFWAVFAVFFPAVTGIEAGIAMSGDLRNPTRALPLGTILAVLVGYAVYLAIPLFLHRVGVDRQTLLTDPLAMQRVARWGEAVVAGVWAASLSSAMGSLLGAPRTLQALARDRVVPRLLGRAFGRRGDPHLATVVTVGIALAGILLGDLNAIGPILAMFFLTSYGVLNFSAGIEELVSNPSWRPRFRIPALVSLAGFGGCLGAMLMIAPGATIIAGFTCVTIYSVMKRRSLKAHWGDMRLGVMMLFTRLFLYRMEGRKLDERTWKPNLLVLSGTPSTRWYLIELADAIAQGRSLVTVVAFIPDEDWTTERVEQITDAIRAYLKKREVPAFIRTLPASDPLEGAATMIRSYGFGPIVPNTILIGESREPAGLIGYARLIQLITRSRRNLVIMRQREEPAEADGERRVDLWWGGMSPHSGFLLAVAVLLLRSPEWARARLQVRMVVGAEEQANEALANLEQFLKDARVTATADVMVAGHGEADRFAKIQQASADAALVILGMRPPGEDESLDTYTRYYQQLLRYTDAFPATALLLAGEQVDFLKIFETGPP